MVTSRLQQSINQYQQQLLMHERSADAALESAYQHALGPINAQLSQMLQQIALMQQAGEPIPPSWLYERDRLTNLKAVINQQMTHYGMLTRMVTGQLQHTAVQLGNHSAQTLLDSTKPPGIAYAFGVPSPGALQAMVGATQPGSPLYDLFNSFGPDAENSAANALFTALLNGDNPRSISQLIQQALGVSRARALTIARTEMLRAYRNAQLANFQANSDVVGNWIWKADLSPRTCAACIAMNGSKHSLEETMSTHPCCRCVMLPETKSWDDILGPLGIDTSNIPDTTIQVQSGSDWLDNQDASTQQAILGAKYQGWKNGDFTLQDIVGYSNSPDWGGSIYEKSLKQLTGGN